MATLDQLAQEAQLLSPADRLRPVESVLESLEPLDPEIERKFADEADSRHEAFQRGEIEARDWKEIHDSLRQ